MPMQRGRLSGIVIAGVCMVAMVALQKSGYTARIRACLTGGISVQERVSQYGPIVRERLTPAFRGAHVPYPPARLLLLGLKQEKRLDVYASDTIGDLRFIRSYPIVAASGSLGPKLREGDRQVPEGIYRVESLNPNSRFHLALRVGYPNEVDRERAAEDGRTQLGGDIMIHGSDASIGCLAMGDPASEDLFVLAAETGIMNVEVVIAPLDLRIHQPPKLEPAWSAQLYQQLSERLRALPIQDRK